MITKNTEIKSINNIKLNNDNRVFYVDAIRVIAILLVILLHATCYFDLSIMGTKAWWIMGYINELCRVGVPLFFMISGFLLLSSKSTDNISSFYKHRLTKILIPFMIWNFLYYCMHRIVNGMPIVSFDYIKELFNNGSEYHLWFIYSIIILYFFMPFVKRIMDSFGTKGQILFLILITFQTTLKPIINIITGEEFYLFLADEGYVGYLGYVVLGYILGRTDFTKKQQAIIYILGTISFIVFPIVNLKTALSDGNFIFNYGYTINHYLEAMAVFVFLKNFSFSGLSGILKVLSGLSLSVYFVHVFAIEAVIRVLPPINRNISWAVIFVLSSVISFFVAFIIENGKSFIKRRF